MAIDITGILNAVIAHAQTLGRFERVNAHAPENAPGSGLSAAVTVTEVGPVAAASGLATTTSRVALSVQVFASMPQEPADDIEPDIIAATDALMAAYSENFDLGGLIKQVDLLGAHGTPLSAQTGYASIGSQAYRVVIITLPLIVNDLWSQAP